ncbi:MAG: hypothetical protein AB7Q81_08165 [Gammaproteobacteria bacterium]
MARRPPLLTEFTEEGLGPEVLDEIIENQVRDGEPPAARATLERLLADGHTREAAIALMACVLSVELHEILGKDETFDAVRYALNLAQLPDLPYVIDDD